ncbi:hypothetical protein GRI89_12765 [Altererythrobacter salegens]|uniref:Uncharacterized protein n=1 Tax=Croceibacterium salegens TaxID=1737568 RepID=A0A6I4SYG7_9SPHN|nr:hypothetical protein [Croceibacterium salegens]MXO60409.1 hypothetical protein [Croceibacterium salegens]
MIMQPTDSVTCANGLRKKDVRNARVTNLWCLAWALTFVATTYAVKRFEPAPLFAAVAVALQLAIGIGAVRSYRHFLREADELTRKIHLEALGVGGAAAMAVGTTSIVLGPSGISPIWGLALTLTALCCGFSFGVARATLKLNA